MPTVRSNTSLPLSAAVAAVITAHVLAGCMADMAPRTSPSQQMANAPIPHQRCLLDRRGQYTTIEVPQITVIRQAPASFFPLLHSAILNEGRQRDIYHVVQATSVQDGVALLTMFVESWKADTTLGPHNGVLAMRMFLIDKVHQCQVGETTGYGEIRYNPQIGFNADDIRAIAESVGWFVGITLMHDP